MSAPEGVQIRVEGFIALCEGYTALSTALHLPSRLKT